jgi:NADH:ubiquinone oxidoreductase subunit 4 (subunit M)
VTYDRTHTMMMNQMGDIGQALPRVFALFTMAAMASLALTGDERLCQRGGRVCRLCQQRCLQ